MIANHFKYISNRFELILTLLIVKIEINQNFKIVGDSDVTGADGKLNPRLLGSETSEGLSLEIIIRSRPINRLSILPL